MNLSINVKARFKIMVVCGLFRTRGKTKIQVSFGSPDNCYILWDIHGSSDSLHKILIMTNQFDEFIILGR